MHPLLAHAAHLPVKNEGAGSGGFMSGGLQQPTRAPANREIFRRHSGQWGLRGTAPPFHQGSGGSHGTAERECSHRLIGWGPKYRQLKAAEFCGFELCRGDVITEGGGSGTDQLDRFAKSSQGVPETEIAQAGSLQTQPNLAKARLSGQ
jgi:hypothetical protein